jgi:hypothetical protein
MPVLEFFLRPETAFAESSDYFSIERISVDHDDPEKTEIAQA